MIALPEYPSRRSVRLRGYDYSRPGAYFVTIVTQDRRCVFGAVVDGQVVLSPAGLIAMDEWNRTALVRPNVESDAFVVMPNHVHGIIAIKGDETRACRWHAPTSEAAPGSLRAASAGSLAAIVNHFKGNVTKQVARLIEGIPLWQRSFYEHVIRDEPDLERIRQYIADNPSSWENDVENPAAARR